MTISNLYQEYILKKSQDETAYQKRPDAQHIIEAYNPLCGDKFKLYLDIENNIITKATFHGYGCAISKAATAVLIEKIENSPLVTLENTLKTYFEALNTEGVLDTIDEAIKAFEVIKSFPERMTCATLSWQALNDWHKESNF
jgi:nitrogen fixation protein NifU and related proteins